MEWVLEGILVLLLAATMFHAMRLERALGVLKRDRAELEALVRGFNASTQAAEQGIVRLREAAEGAGRHIARQVESAARLRDDLAFLTDRGEKAADRLDNAVRAARHATGALEPTSNLAPATLPPPLPDLPMPEAFARDSFPRPPEPEPAPAARPRSRAEQELMRALGLSK